MVTPTPVPPLLEVSRTAISRVDPAVVRGFHGGGSQRPETVDRGFDRKSSMSVI